MATIVRLMSAVLTALVLTACSTVGPGPGPGGGTLDPLRDDIGALLIAFDLPRGLGPAKGSLFTYDVANGGPAEHLRLTPLQADVDGIPASLPPPGMDRQYYLFAFSETDKLAIRNAQLTAQARGATAQNVTLGMIPKLCTAGQVDPNVVMVSVYAVLPGKSPLPFLNRTLLSTLLQQPGSTQMGPCV
ncbi:MAG: hypothetical protein JNL14_20420 [Devosia sp.]|uniref:hypothetical protein n=1 Tax=Devosia sp. TaxID=1871048 RepID=UPI001A387ACD|nr:hypothetical protein [Devosia sp.]MBL8600109.1 hypothetical protein [Devosia sp.]